MSNYREIVTKAVIGKAKKYFKNDYLVECEYKPTTILGCWVINHTFKGNYNNGIVNINGYYDVNIWYSYDNDSKTTVTLKRINYSEDIKVDILENNSNTDIIVRSLKQPNCINAVSDDNNISVTIEKELAAEVIGDTKVKIASVDVSDDWDKIDEVDSDYLK